MHDKTPPPASIREACRLSGLGRTKIYELISDGRLTTVKIDRRTLVPFDELARLVSPEAERGMTTTAKPGDTLFYRHQNEIEEAGGRFAKLTPATLTGATEVPEVPRLPASAWSNQVLPNEGPLNRSVNQMMPVGTAQEVEQSLQKLGAADDV